MYGRFVAGLVKLCAPKRHMHGDADCTSIGKRPLEPGWNREALARYQRADEGERTLRLRDLAAHLAAGGNIGLCPPPHTLVLDADSADATQALAARVPADAPRQRTARGMHFGPFGVAAGFELVARAGTELRAELGAGLVVDVRAGGLSQIVVAPSIHASGHVYSWEIPLPSRLEEVPDLPAALHEALVSAGVLRRAGEQSRGHAPAGDDDEIPEGERNDRLYRFACRLRGQGWPLAEILEALLRHNTQRCRPPLPDAEVQAIAESAARHTPGNREEHDEPPTPDDDDAPGPDFRAGFDPGEEPVTPAPPPVVLDLSEIGFTGDRLRAIRNRPKPAAPLPGVLDPEPHLHVLLGRPKSGKTTLGLALARAWCLAAPPWPGAPALPGTRVLAISREQEVTRLDAVLCRLALHAGDGRGDAWADRITLVARDRELPPGGRQLLTLDGRGLELLRSALLLARDHGDPYGLVILESLNRLKPPGVEERDNDALAEWLEDLELLAVDCAVHVILMHHVGHTAGDFGRSEARSAGRGASAISAVAQVVWLLERIAGDLRHRRLEVDGNAILPTELLFECATEEAVPPGVIFYFKPAAPEPERSIADCVDPGQAVSLTELAWRLSGQPRQPNRKPPGVFLREAGECIRRWVRQGLGETFEGKRGATMLRRKTGTNGGGAEALATAEPELL